MKPNNMKFKFILYALLIFISEYCISQDIITKPDGKIISAKILKVDLLKITYKPYDNLGGPLIILPLCDVLKIYYDSTKKETYLGKIGNALDTSSVSIYTDTLLYYNKGISDALLNYKGFYPASEGTFILSMVSPFIGLIPAISCASTKPREKSLGFRYNELTTHPAYNTGYKLKSRQIKRNKVWEYWALGSLVNVFLVLYIGSR